MITIGTKVAILPCDDYRNRFIGTKESFKDIITIKLE